MLLLGGALPAAPPPLAPCRSALLPHAGLTARGALYGALRTDFAAPVQVQQDHRHHKQRAALLALHLHIHIRSVGGGQRARRGNIQVRHDPSGAFLQDQPEMLQGKQNKNTMLLVFFRAPVLCNSFTRSYESPPGNVVSTPRVSVILCVISLRHKGRFCAAVVQFPAVGQIPKSCRRLASSPHNCVKTCERARRRRRRRSDFAVLFLKRNKFAESQGVIGTPRSDWSLPERCLTRYQEFPSKRRKCGSCCPIASSLGGASGLGPARSRKP